MKAKTLAENTKELCPNCETGQKTYLLDRHSPFCPHLACHDGANCSMFVPLEYSKKTDVERTCQNTYIIPLQEKAKYKLRDVIYNVTAHFRNDKENLKSKVENLLVDDVHNSN